MQRVRVYFWTDSQIVLHWVHKGTNTKPFISHRVKEICEAFLTAIWSFTPSADNPADLLTRGISADQLKSSTLWTCGPAWLLDRSTWPTWTPTSTLLLQAEEEASPTPVTQPSTVDTTESILLIIDISCYSSIHRLFAVTAYVFRFVHNLCKAQLRASGPLSSVELTNA